MATAPAEGAVLPHAFSVTGRTSRILKERVDVMGVAAPNAHLSHCVDSFFLVIYKL